MSKNQHDFTHIQACAYCSVHERKRQAGVNKSSLAMAADVSAFCSTTPHASNSGLPLQLMNLRISSFCVHLPYQDALLFPAVAASFIASQACYCTMMRMMMLGMIMMMMEKLLGNDHAA